MPTRPGKFAAKRAAKGYTQETLAQSLGVELSTVGRWERGSLTPQPRRRAEIAAVLDVTLEELEGLLTGSGAEHAVPSHGPLAVRATSSPSSEQSPQHDTAEAYRCNQQLRAGAIGPETFAEVDLMVRRCGTSYVGGPLPNLLADIRTAYTTVFGLLKANHFPTQLRHLYLYASRISGLRAHVCLDQGSYQEADAHASTAWLCAEQADDNHVRAWVRSVQSLISYWDGKLDTAVDLARDGSRYGSPCTVAARLPSLEARASAARGDKHNALDALNRSATARDVIGDTSEECGMFTFPEAKQQAYTSTTLLTLGTTSHAARAIAYASQSLALYEAVPPAEQSAGDMLAARLDLASANFTLNQLDGTEHYLTPLLATAPTCRTASVIKRANALATRIDNSRYSGTPRGLLLKNVINEFCAQPSTTATGSETSTRTRERM